jgi:hypothetical protein
MSKITASARGENCTIKLIGVCNGNPDAVVYAHSNKLQHGKGRGLKASDRYGAYACSACHDVIDGRVPRPKWMGKAFADEAFSEGMARTHTILLQKGLIVA